MYPLSTVFMLVEKRKNVFMIQAGKSISVIGVVMVVPSLQHACMFFFFVWLRLKCKIHRKSVQITPRPFPDKLV